MRIMAIDYGAVRTGIAISDPSGFITGFTDVIIEKDTHKLIQGIVDVVSAHSVTKIVVGYPKNMDGSPGSRAPLCEELAQQLQEATNLPVDLWDERRTTVQAHQILHAAGKKMKKHKKNVDAVAASLILESYLDAHAMQR